MRTTDYANNIFEQPWWLDVVAPGSWNEILVKNKKNEVIGRQVVVSNKKKIYMPPMTQTIGTWFSDEVKHEYGSQKKVIQEILQEMGSYKDICIRLAPENEYVLPYKWAGYIIEPRFTYRISDLTDVDSLYEKFNKTAKKNIKSANNKVKISYDLDFNEFWGLLCKTFEIQSRKNPMSRELIKNIIDYCEENGCGKYICAKDKDGIVHSAAYYVYDSNVFYYLLGGTDVEYRSSGAQSLVIWEGIKYASLHSKLFDFEGSMIEGIENFFRQFGGKCCVYYEIRKQSLIKELLLLIKPKIKKIIGYK